MDEDDDIIKCPFCGRKDTTTKSDIKDPVIISGVLQQIWYCWNCKKQFSEMVP